MRTARGQEGQATLEFALLLPFVLALVLGVAEVGMLLADNSRVIAAAREAARVAAVTSDADQIEDAARLSGLDDVEVTTKPRPELRTQGDPVTATVIYEPGGHLPFVGLATRRIELTASATMRIERP